jgi:endonuclease/exonuclease/phosphatase family metal-dependent hydrolase
MVSSRMIGTLVTGLAAFLIPATSSGLTVTTFNLEWFGRGGDINGFEENEYRQPTVKEFIDKHLTKTDLFVFQEVTHVQALKNVLPGWDCRTYEADNTKHQHVAACLKPGFTMEDSTIESVRLGSQGLRPAFKVVVTAAGGAKTAVIGLHLKAGATDTSTRLQQVQALTEALAAGDSTPLLVVGDFNTFPKDKTGLIKDDHELIAEVFQTKGLAQVGGTQPTYGGFYGKTFDRVWTKNTKTESFWVKGPCVNDPENAGRYSERSFYQRFVSDHCAVSVSVSPLPQL